VTMHYPVIVERESNGTFSAWVAGLPGVYAAADTAPAAKQAIRSAVIAHIEKLEASGGGLTPRAHVSMLRYESGARTRRDSVRYVEMGELKEPSPSRS